MKRTRSDDRADRSKSFGRSVSDLVVQLCTTPRETVRSRPYESLLVATGAGFLLGARPGRAVGLAATYLGQHALRGAVAASARAVRDAVAAARAARA